MCGIGCRGRIKTREVVMFDVDEIRRDFPILERMVHGKPLVYLDSGATAHKPLCVTETVEHLHNRLRHSMSRRESV